MSGMEKWKHLQIPFGKIKEATNNFKKETGRGGYGSVYEGHLLINGINTKVAVKRLNEKGQQGLKEFLNEIDLLCGQQHENIITLVGYCDEGNEKIIVYEFAERGSLDYYFRFKNANYTLPWLQRLKIVVDVARGLDHLHNHLPKKQVIIHRDIKTSNILLDHNWVAKISDFGLSKTTVTGFDRSTVVTYACGTPGYVEPELKCYFTANPKSDVYSFGMLLFEVLCGRLCNVPYGKDEERLSAEVAEKYKDKLDNIIDPGLREEMDPNALRMFSAIAYKCLQRREQRPLMNFVKKELEETLKIQGCNYRPTHSMAKWMPLKIPLSDIKVATKDFSKVIARGGFGSMYEGELYVHGIYMKVVVKRSDKEFGQGIKEFLTEIQLLSGGQHENVVNIVGYCDEGKEKITGYKKCKYLARRQVGCKNLSLWIFQGDRYYF
ncbi:hypothetical protein M8C21_026770 [Ambrosia artemisiifolia]|uniref:Protein kinase domain-containing protein n=1 Tax=Ambrosia artemisiifolia TaxID=4212 RepID=A0AAD5CBJ4_AMBAR|nr:hypothetical protein M8C21_026770 [Ambrosia artemisiifolia]